MQWLRASLRWILVTLGVVLLTSITVDATLSPNGFSQSALGILASSAVPKTTCGEGMVEITSSDSRLCVDAFEVAPGPECPQSRIVGAIDTRSNLDEPECVPVSQSGLRPWTHVSFHQAYELCARTGKRLPSTDEWYAFSVGTPDSMSAPVCNIKSGTISDSDEGSRCKNGSGIYNTVGNVWEWVDGEVSDGMFKGRALPPSGYVAELDKNGIALGTSENPDDDYYRDYFWAESSGQFGILHASFGVDSNESTHKVLSRTESIAIPFGQPDSLPALMACERSVPPRFCNVSAASMPNVVRMMALTTTTAPFKIRLFIVREYHRHSGSRLRPRRKKD